MPLPPPFSPPISSSHFFISPPIVLSFPPHSSITFPLLTFPITRFSTLLPPSPTRFSFPFHPLPTLFYLPYLLPLPPLFKRFDSFVRMGFTFEVTGRAHTKYVYPFYKGIKWNWIIIMIITRWWRRQWWWWWLRIENKYILIKSSRRLEKICIYKQIENFKWWCREVEI